MMIMMTRANIVNTRFLVVVTKFTIIVYKDFLNLYGTRSSVVSHLSTEQAHSYLTSEIC